MSSRMKGKFWGERSKSQEVKREEKGGHFSPDQRFRISRTNIEEIDLVFVEVKEFILEAFSIFMMRFLLPRN